MKFRTRPVALLAGLVMIAGLGACTSEPDPRPARTTAPVTTEPPEPIRSPLTGLEIDAQPDNPVFVVKIDNTRPANPQVALDQADLVVEEMVEGGVTRLAAMFHSRLPDVVGPVRSMRATDIGIAAPVGGELVASGGARITLNRIKSAGITFFSHDNGNAGFWRDRSRRAPYNVFVDLTRIDEQSSGELNETPYFAWAKGDAEATAPTTVSSQATVRFSPLHSTQFTYVDGTWKRSNGFAGAKDFAAQNLVVLFAEEVDAGYRDPSGSPVPETKFEGGGRAVVFIGDKVAEGTWAKPNPGATVELRDEAGTPIVLPPGKVWLQLPTTRRGSISY